MRRNEKVFLTLPCKLKTDKPPTLLRGKRQMDHMYKRNGLFLTVGDKLLRNSSSDLPIMILKYYLKRSSRVL